MGSQIARMQKQHLEILDIARNVVDLAKPPLAEATADEIVAELKQLAAALRAHLWIEDDVLYPRLLQMSDEKIRSTAQRFSDEMGGIQESFKRFMESWDSMTAITERTVAFAEAFSRIATAIKQRIEAEENELYPMLDL